MVKFSKLSIYVLIDNILLLICVGFIYCLSICLTYLSNLLSIFLGKIGVASINTLKSFIFFL